MQCMVVAFLIFTLHIVEHNLYYHQPNAAETYDILSFFMYKKHSKMGMFFLDPSFLFQCCCYRKLSHKRVSASLPTVAHYKHAHMNEHRHTQWGCV